MAESKHYLEAELEELFRSDLQVWRFLCEGSLDGVWYWDLEQPEHEYMSPEFWRLFGFDPATKQHLAAEWQDLIFPEDLEQAKTNLNLHIADPEHRYDQIVRYHCADGEVAWVRCRGLAIRSADGKAVRMLGAHNDITQQKRETSTLLTQIMDTARSGIVGLDSAGRVVSINAAGRHMVGGLRDELPCDWPQDVMFIDRENLQPLSPQENPINQALAGTVLNGQIFSMTSIGSREARYVRVSSAPVAAEKAFVHAVIIFDDISEQEKNRQQVERRSRLDALGQLTGGIAHDFNNLLATVEYALELASSVDDDVQRQTYLTTARTSIEVGAELTKRLLAFAKQQPGLATSKDVTSILDDFRKLATPLIEANIKINFVIKESNLLVYCDTVQLGNALLNLLLNARDAILRSGTGSQITVLVRGLDEIGADVTLRHEHPHSYTAQGLRAEQSDGQGRADNAAYRYVEFAVTDDGPGMTEEVKRRAVDPFFTTKNTNSGTGLGLSMVYGFIQQSEGELRLYSEPGRGTTVRLLLPRGTPLGQREEPLQRHVPVKGNGERILVIEDQLALTIMMQELIKSLGYEVETVRTGQDALALIDDCDEFDLIITDIVMPGALDGFKLASAIRERLPDVPLLYMSGYTGYSEDDMGAVVAPMLQKPCPPHELAAAIRTALRAGRMDPPNKACS